MARVTSTSLQATRQRRVRGSLSREEVIEGSIDLIERHGLSELSMAALAKRLNSGVTSIYWYFRTKDELLVAIAEQVTTDIYSALPPVAVELAWDEALLDSMRAFRHQLLRHRAFIDIFTERAYLLFFQPTIGAQIAHRIEAEISNLTRSGLGAKDAVHAFISCSIFVRGFVIFEHGQQQERNDVHSYNAVTRMLGSLDPEDFPTLSRIENYRDLSAYNDEQFERGLKIIVDGIRYETERAAPRPRRRNASAK